MFGIHHFLPKKPPKEYSSGTDNYLAGSGLVQILFYRDFLQRHVMSFSSIKCILNFYQIKEGNKKSIMPIHLLQIFTRISDEYSLMFTKHPDPFHVKFLIFPIHNSLFPIKTNYGKALMVFTHIIFSWKPINNSDFCKYKCLTMFTISLI